MTRNEAVEKVTKLFYKPETDLNDKPTAISLVHSLEALGLLKFEEEKKEVIELFRLQHNDIRQTAPSIHTNEIVNKFGVVKIELWPEGLVLWVGGKIKWESWESDTPQREVNECIWIDFWPKLPEKHRFAPMDLVNALRKRGLKIVKQ